MKESELLGKLLPGHPDILPIIENIREKYQIPPINPEDDDITQLLLTNDEIPWDAVRRDIDDQVHEIPLFSDVENEYIRKLRDLNKSLDSFDELPELQCLAKETRESLKNLFVQLLQSRNQYVGLLDDLAYKPITDMIFEYLLTGKTREAPQEWFGSIQTVDFFGEKVILAMAGEAADPKEITEQFKNEFTKAFGKREHKITDTHLNTAEYLTMQLQGDSITHLVFRYKELHPTEFPTDTSSPEYKKAMQNHVDMMEKRLDRLRKVLEEIAGDKI
jgi:hypothetical protein